MSEPLQFDQADDPAGAQPRGCANCARPITDEYYSVGDKLLCTACAGHLRDHFARRGRFAPALGLGLLAALASAVGYFAVRALTGMQLGIVSVAVGYVVAKGVFRGAGNVGGRRFQLLAVVLTYFAVGLSYGIELARALAHEGRGPGNLLFALLLTPLHPILMAVHAPLSGIIDAFALWEAWRLTQGRTLPLSGPHHVTPGSRT